jgi:hypothetical protein
MSESGSASVHLTNIEMARYLDRKLSSDERDRVEAHLASCANCRELTLGSQRVLRKVQRPRRLIAVGALAAAAAVLIVIGRLEPETPDVARERAPVANTTSLIVYGPTGSTSIANLRFAWGAAENVESYRLSLTTADGAEVWSHSGLDTTAVPPSSVSLRPAGNYFWVVDAVLKDGTTRSTGLREFSLAP